ncbi:MAG: hypothetical protein HZC28_04020 [Spirochaetes bacterium]|nr:hypothetical protein [Spirochaetota bacterium]
MKNLKGLIKDLFALLVPGTGALLGGWALLTISGHAHQFWIIAGFFFAIGMLFEILTKDLWTYPDLFFRIPFVKEDISFTLPTAWSGLMTLSFALTLYLESVFRFTAAPIWIFPSVIYIIFPGTLVAFIVGNFMEAVFHAIDYFRYTDYFFKRFGRTMLPWNVPLQVALGYAYFWGGISFSALKILLAVTYG